MYGRTLLQFTTVYCAQPDSKTPLATLPLLLRPLRTTPYRSPNHRQLHQSRLVIAAPVCFIPYSQSYRAPWSVSAPVLLPAPEFASVIAPVRLLTTRTASSFCRDDDDDGDGDGYRVPCCAMLCLLLGPLVPI